MKKNTVVEIPQIPVVVCTGEQRGVFFGYITPDVDKTAKIIRLTEARMAVHWDAETRSVLGLAATGPKTHCRISPAVPAITLQSVSAVIEATPAAAKAWESAPWR